MDGSINVICPTFPNGALAPYNFSAYRDMPTHSPAGCGALHLFSFSSSVRKVPRLHIKTRLRRRFTSCPPCMPSVAKWADVSNDATSCTVCIELLLDAAISIRMDSVIYNTLMFSELPTHSSTRYTGSPAPHPPHPFHLEWTHIGPVLVGQSLFLFFDPAVVYSYPLSLFMHIWLHGPAVYCSCGAAVDHGLTKLLMTSSPSPEFWISILRIKRTTCTAYR